MEKTLIDDIREAWLAEYDRRLDTLYHLMLLMEDMRNFCIYRVNGACWLYCNARQFCRPEESGLVTVQDLRDRE